MNETPDTFGTQTTGAPEAPDYAALQRELDQLNAERERAKLLREVQRARAAKAAGFPDETPFALADRTLTDDLQKEKLFKIVDPKKYKGTTQHDLNTFIRECNGVFEVRRNTYADDKDKILFARSFLDGVPAEDWERHQKTIDLTATKWSEFIDFLQEHLNPKHLRLLETNAKLKKVRQLNGQSVADLIVYLNSLEMQVPEELSDYQKYSNLMEALHPYLKAAVTRRTNAIVSRAELEEIARLAEKTEPVPEYIKKAKKPNQAGGAKQQRFQPYNRSDRPGSDAPQGAVQGNGRGGGRGRGGYRGRGRGRGGRSDTGTNRPQVECWNCGIRGHYRADCRKPPQNGPNNNGNNDSGKAQGQST
jgi:hypothetical protein